jgi:hypothetical protein
MQNVSETENTNTVNDPGLNVAQGSLTGKQYFLAKKVKVFLHCLVMYIWIYLEEFFTLPHAIQRTRMPNWRPKNEFTQIQKSIQISTILCHFWMVLQAKNL